MEDYQPAIVRERNPITHEKHRREVLRQITLPLVIGIALILIAAIFICRSSTAGASVWADISLIWLIVPMLFAGLLFLIILAATAYGVIKLVTVLPFYFKQALDWLIGFNISVAQVGNKVTEPFIRLYVFMAKIEFLGNKVRKK